MDYIEKAKLILLTKSPYYYSLLNECTIIESEEVPLAGVVVSNNMQMLVNRKTLESKKSSTVAGILEHEFEHLLKDHIKAYLNGSAQSYFHKKNLKFSPEITNVAMDLEINPTIPFLKKDKEMYNNLCFPEKMNLESDRGWDYYIQNLIDKAEVKENAPDHSYFYKSSRDQDVFDSTISDALQRAADKSCGKIPKEVSEWLKQYELKKTIPWELVLRRFINFSSKFHYLRTWKKKNPRFSQYLPFIKKVPYLNLLVAVDISGSMPDSVVERCFNEINNISKSVKCDISVVQFTTQIIDNKKWTNDFEFKRLGSGGTDFNCVHNYANETNQKVVIWLTDGEAPFPNKETANYNDFWLIYNQDRGTKPPFSDYAFCKEF